MSKHPRVYFVWESILKNLDLFYYCLFSIVCLLLFHGTLTIVTVLSYLSNNYIALLLNSSGSPRDR